VPNIEGVLHDCASFVGAVDRNCVVMVRKVVNGVARMGRGGEGVLVD
jgi:hypothetical protein